MKVILLQDIPKLGKAGEVKEVRSGYGFNFLLPEGLVELATPGAIKQAEKIIAKKKTDAAQATAESKAKAEAINGKTITIKTKAEKGKLFGSVGADEIAAAVSATGTEIEARHIALEKPLKEVGTFAVEAHFGNDIKAKFEVTIEAE